MSLKFAGGAETRHHFFSGPEFASGLASLCIHSALLAALWSYSLSDLVRSETRRHRVVSVQLSGVSVPPSKVVKQTDLPSDEFTRQTLNAGPTPTISKSLSPSTAGTSTAQHQEVDRLAPSTEPPPRDSLTSDNESFSLPNQLNFPFQVRPRSVFTPDSRSVRQESPNGKNSVGEQQWARQKARADIQRQMIVNLLAELNNDTRPSNNMSCDMRPRTTCSVDYDPALVIIRRYEGFFADPNSREHFSFRFSDGRWSVDVKNLP